ncbi:hypothetical protein ATK23_0434 [Glutamicibacter mysorens]|uniref:PknH-like protein n=2 Tax=Glutamicibacter mysorens TaxID=257984 RepID=A0ABX4MWA5_9MICC|nr:hypothetical protein ATK23_0434 [Glutamicibacter mysorens]
MTKRLTLWALPLAVSMMLAGCSSNSASEPAQSAASTTSVDSQKEAASGGALTAEQVKSVASKLMEGDNAVQVVGNEQMQQQLEIAKNAKAPSGIKPEKCAELNAKYSVTDLTASVSATATSSSESVGKVVQVFSLTDDATRNNVSQALTLDDLEGCENVTVETGGEKIETERQILPLDVKADQSLTMSTQMDAGGGQLLTSVVVQALRDGDFVLVTLQTGSQQAAELAAQAVELTDRAFAEIDAVRKQ